MGPAGPAGTLPAPASASLASTTAQTLVPNGHYAPVHLTLYTPRDIRLEEDGCTVTLLRDGLFLINYAVIPSAGANADASAALLLPNRGGVPLTTAVRDFFNADYLSGTIRLIDAVLVASCIALGVGFMLKLYSLFPGGLL